MKLGKEIRAGSHKAFEFHCPACDIGTLAERLVQQKFEYGVDNPVSLSAEVMVHHCGSCGFEFTDESAEVARHAAVCRFEGLLTPQEIEAIRIRYGYSRTEFAGITKLGEATIARWERGSLLQNAAYDKYLRLLANPAVFSLLVESRANALPHFGAAGGQSRFKALRLEQECRHEAKGFVLRKAG